MHQNHTWNFLAFHPTPLKELQKRYYDMALFCHPDNGGNTEDMQIVQHCYEEAKQIVQQKEESEERVRKVLDVLERGEINTCTTSDLPNIHNIFDEVHDSSHISFNACQNNQNNADTSQHLYFYNDKDPYTEQGYGEYMIERWQTSVQSPVCHANIQGDEIQLRPLSSLDIPSGTPSHHVETLSTSPSNQTHSVQNLCSTENTMSNGYPNNAHSEQHDFTVTTPLFEHTCTKRLLKGTDYKSAFEHTL